MDKEVILTKSEFVLGFATRAGDTVYFQGEWETPDLRSIMVFSVQKYEDMGEPEIITVTIRPGDHLNEETDDRTETGNRKETGSD